MGLKFSDALRLSWSNIGEHKIRSAIVILTISIIFGLLMGINFVLRGLETTLIDASVIPTGGKVYLETKFYNNHYGKAEERLAERLQKYHGQAVGTYTTYQGPAENFLYTRVISASAVQDFITTDLSQVPNDKIPALIPEGGLEEMSPEYSSYEAHQAFIRDKIYVVGYFPATEEGEYNEEYGITYASKPTLPGANPLNLILDNIYGDGRGTDPILIDDGSGKTTRYIENMIAETRAQAIAAYDASIQDYLREDPDFAITDEEIRDEHEYLNSWEPDTYTYTIALFDNPYDAVAFTAPYDTPEYANFESVSFTAQSIFTNTTSISDLFRSFRLMLNFLQIVLLVTAVIITAFTFAHIIDQDAATVALYRSMGATTGNIYLIYFLYILELCGLAIFTSLLIALIIVLTMTFTSAAALGERLQAFYLLDSVPKVTFLGLDVNFFIVILTILLVAPLTLATTHRRFSGKHIARKLKEDR